MILLKLGAKQQKNRQQQKVIYLRLRAALKIWGVQPARACRFLQKKCNKSKTNIVKIRPLYLCELRGLILLYRSHVFKCELALQVKLQGGSI